MDYSIWVKWCMRNRGNGEGLGGRQERISGYGCIENKRERRRGFGGRQE